MSGRAKERRRRRRKGRWTDKFFLPGGKKGCQVTET